MAKSKVDRWDTRIFDLSIQLREQTAHYAEVFDGLAGDGLSGDAQPTADANQSLTALAVEIVEQVRLGASPYLSILLDRTSDDADHLHRAICAVLKVLGLPVARVQVREQGTELLASVMAAMRSLPGGETVAPPRTAYHPSLQFRQIFDDITDQLGSPFVLILDDVDSVFPRPGSVDAFAALRAALIPRRDSVAVVFLLRDPAIRQAVFHSPSQPMYLFATEWSLSEAIADANRRAAARKFIPQAAPE